MINSYEELLEVANKRREETLTIEVDMGAVYSPEHEAAKKELRESKALMKLAGENGFLSNDLDKLESRVAETKPTPNLIWVRYRRLDLATWSLLMKSKTKSTPFDQYEQVLPKVFEGIFNDPESEEPITSDHNLVSTVSAKSILSGGVLQSVIQAFMDWQNSGGEVSIHPMSSGHV